MFSESEDDESSTTTTSAEVAARLKNGISRQLSTGSVRVNSGKSSFTRQSSLDPRRNALRFSFGRQSSMDPIRRNRMDDDDDDDDGALDDALNVPENLDSTMQLLFMACRGDVLGVEDLLNDGVDVNSIDLDGRTALHIAACEGHVEVVKLLLSRKAHIDARDRWGSTAAADAKHYGYVELYNILRSRGAKVPKPRKTPMTVINPKEVPDYELNPLELQIRKVDGITKGIYQVAKWNGTKVSVKILDKDSYSDPEIINAFKNELMLFERVRHPNVVQFIGAVTQNVPMMIVSEYHPKMLVIVTNLPRLPFPWLDDLGSYIQKKGRLAPSKALRFALDIARGMNYLHECKPNPIIHCDLKPKNILLDTGGQLKVAGFGLLHMSKLHGDSGKVKVSGPGANIDLSNFYIAPEIYKNAAFDRSVDAYSFGLILYEMIEGIQPFSSKSPEEASIIMCLEGKRPPFKSKSRSYPPDLKELIEECWDENPVARPTFSEIIVRLDRIIANCSKHGWWKDTFKLPWK